MTLNNVNPVTEETLEEDYKRLQQIEAMYN